MIGELAGLGCGAAWAMISIVLRIASERLNPVVVNGLRCTFAGITTALLSLALGRLETLQTTPAEGVAAVIASGVLGQGLGDLLFVRGMKQIGASRALPISGIYPLFTLGLAMLFLGERMAWVGVVGSLLVVCGISLLAFPYGSLKHALLTLSSADRGGVLLALAAACLWAVSAVVLKQGLAHVDLVVANGLRMGTATLLLLAMSTRIPGGAVPVELNRRSFAIMAVAGFFSAFSALMYITSVYYAGAAKAAILSSTSPLFGIPLSLIFLHERINSRILGGTILSVAGVWLVLGG